MRKNVPFLLILLLTNISNAYGYDFFFLNKDYSNNINIQCQISSKNTAASLLLTTENEIAYYRQTFEELKDSQSYLLIRIKNNGNKSAWGELSCKIEQNRLITVIVPFLSANMSNWNHIIISIPPFIYTKEIRQLYPNVECVWQSLYAK